MKYFSNGVTVKIKEGSESDPSVLYKYRNWSDDNHKKLITKPIVYLASPGRFEDPFDCKNNVRYDILADNQIFKKILFDSINENGDLYSISEHIKMALYEFNISPSRDPLERYKLECKFEKEFNERFGVFSLIADPLNLKMWNKYGNKFKGFCIGYDTKLLFNSFKGGGGEVIYVDELPIISPYDNEFIQIHKQVFHKLKKWEFEKEYRTHKTWKKRISDNERNIPINSQCVKEIIFGFRISPKDIAEIKSIVEINMPHVILKYTNIDFDRMELSIL